MQLSIFQLVFIKKYSYIFKRRYLNQGKVKQMFEEHLDEKENSAKELWKMMVLEFWFRKWIDGGSQQNKRRLANV